MKNLKEKEVLKTKGITQRLKNGWANWMTLATAEMSRKNLLVLLIVFVALSCTYCILLTVDAVNGTSNRWLSISHIQKPSNLTAGDDVQTSSTTQPEIIKLRNFRNYMDSLQRTKEGRQVYDSILLRHPGLMDSLMTIEKVYR